MKELPLRRSALHFITGLRLLEPVLDNGKNGTETQYLKNCGTTFLLLVVC